MSMNPLSDEGDDDTNSLVVDLAWLVLGPLESFICSKHPLAFL